MSWWKGWPLAILAALGLSSATASAEEGDQREECADKGQYTLFNPTPSQCMRDFEPDHPDLTSNPFTIDAGHVEPEITLFSYSRSSPDKDRTVTDRFTLFNADIRLGITNNFELGVEIEPLNVVGTHFSAGADDEWDVGLDSTALEAKLNLFGNDTFEKPGSMAFAVLPVVDVPTGRGGVGEDDVEGSVAFPLGIKLSHRTELELMTKYDFIKNEERSGYHVEYFNSGSFSYDWTGALSTYFEVATRFGNEDPSGGIVLVNIGVAYKPNKNLQLDCGINFGVTEAADPINPFVGLARRF